MRRDELKCAAAPEGDSSTEVNARNAIVLNKDSGRWNDWNRGGWYPAALLFRARLHPLIASRLRCIPTPCLPDTGIA